MTNIMRVRAVSSGWAGGPGLNTFYFISGDAGGAPADTDAQLAHDRVHNAFDAGDLLYPNTWTMTVNPNVDVLTTETGDLVNSFSVTPSAVIPGANSIQFGPIAAMNLLRLNTSTYSDGSRLQGRAFLGPSIKDYDANGTPVAGVLALVQTIGDELLDPGVGGVPKLVVWRRPRAASAGPPVVTARAGSYGIVTSTAAPDFYAVLRSRRA